MVYNTTLNIKSMKKLFSLRTSNSPLPSTASLSLWKLSNRKEKCLIAVGILFSCLSAIAACINTLSISQVTYHMISFDRNNEKSEKVNAMFMEHVVDFIIQSFSVLLIQVLAKYVMIVVFNYTAACLVFRLRCELFQAIMNWDVEWFDLNDGGELPSRINDDLEKIQDGIDEKLGIYIDYLFTFVISFVYCALIDWKLTITYMAPIPLMLIILAAINVMVGKLIRKTSDAHSQASAIAEEVFTGIRTVYAFDGREKEVERYREKVKKAEQIGRKHSLCSGIFMAALWFMIHLTGGWRIWYGLRALGEESEVQMNEKRIEDILQIIYLISASVLHLALSTVLLDKFTAALASSQKIFELFQEVPKINPDANRGLQPPTCLGNITFNNISFRYPSRPDVKVLSEINLSAKHGEIVAIVGHSGCGKSTCIQLIQRLYDMDDGSIMIDGVDIKTLNVNWLRNKIGVVGQEPVLFGTTIYENIQFGRVDATQEDIENAAKIANAHEFIVKLPKGYNTQVGERGTQLSGGQKQRIAIARAIIRNPTILLLDEATSALDTRSETLVQDALERASKGRTTIVVAHRLSTIRNANRIYVMEKGRIINTGSHNELMSNCPAYYSLVTSQINQDIENDENPDSNILITESESRMENDASEATLCNKTETKEKTITLKPISTWQILKLHPSDWPHLLFGSIAALTTGICLPLAALLTASFVGTLTNDPSQFNNAADFQGAIWIILSVVKAFTFFTYTYFLGISGESLIRNVREKLFRSILSQEIGWFDEKANGIGILCSRLSSDIEAMRMAAGTRIGIDLMTIGTLLVVFVIAAHTKWSLVIVGSLFFPVIYFITKTEKKLRKKEHQKKIEANGISTKILVETISNIRTVASLGLQKIILEKYTSLLLSVLDKLKTNMHIRGICFSITTSLLMIWLVPLLALGCYFMTRGILNTYEVYSAARAWSVASILLSNSLAFAPNVQRGQLAAANILKILNRRSKIENSGASYRNLKYQSKGNIKFDSVEFSYPTKPDAKILQGLTMPIDEGHNVALVGQSGCGKSTCIQLLQRFYDTARGRILVDSNDIRTIPQRQLRLQFGIVSQEATVFKRTIAENIAYGDNNRPIAFNEIIQAAKEANIHNFIMSLPLGYETKMGDKGAQLSGGQKQRITIARALIRNPKILLLDEATSALDVESEKVVQAALNLARRGRTCITIAHRFGTIVDADVIFVMKEGRIAESGSHRELLQLKGIYYELYRSQS